MTGPIDIAKKFFINLGVDTFGVGIVRGWLNEQLQNATPGQLNEYILTDGNLWGDLPDSYITQAQQYRHRYRDIFDKFENRITTELIAGWIEKDWPPLYSTIINTPNGLQWLDKQVQQIKRQIIEM